jgi:hypothetical protein
LERIIAEKSSWPNRNSAPAKTLAAAVAVMSLIGFGLVAVVASPGVVVPISKGLSSAFGPTHPQAATGVGDAPHALANPSAAIIGPNFAAAKPGGKVGTSMQPGCASAPCPMGITDYGLSPNSSAYSLSPKVVEDQIDIYGLAIGTSSGGGCLDPDAAAGQCFTIQSNVVSHNQYVKNTKGSYWAQNVPEVAYDSSCSTPCVSGTYSVTFLDNIWNFSYSHGCTSTKNTGKGCINPAEISGDGLKKCSATGGAPNLYYCVGPIVYGLSPPFTVETWTDINDFNHGGCTPSTGTYGKSCINFYGAVLASGSVVFGGYYDGVTFHSGSHAAGTPTFYIDRALSPLGLYYDDEWVIGGPGGGSSNAVDIEGDMTAETSVCTVSTCYNYPSIQHAWSSGADTAESISDVYMAPLFNSRDLGYIEYSTDNPNVALW